MARYADTLLADGEQIVLRTRQHWLATIIDGRIPWAMLLASLVGLWIALGMAQSGARQIVGAIVVGVMVVALAWLGKVYWAWSAQDYLVTNRRVVKVEGILNKRSADSSLEKINDAVLEQNLVGRLFRFGDLDILTAAETAIDRYRMLADAAGFKKTMLDQKHLLEEEGYRVPGPPLRAAPLVPATPPARPMSPDEITKAVADLADLRDRGAITPDEYEAKKKDLLGRL